MSKTVTDKQLYKDLHIYEGLFLEFSRSLLNVKRVSPILDLMQGIRIHKN